MINARKTMLCLHSPDDPCARCTEFTVRHQYPGVSCRAAGVAAQSLKQMRFFSVKAGPPAVTSRENRHVIM